MIKNQTAMSWKEFKKLNFIIPNLMPKLPPVYKLCIPQTEAPFMALVIATAYSGNCKYSGIHVFFASRFPNKDGIQYRGYIPRYFSGDNPYYVLAQKLRWGSIVELRRDERSKGDIPILEYHDAITAPIEFGTGESLYEITPRHDATTNEVFDWIDERRNVTMPKCQIDEVRLKLLEAYKKMGSPPFEH